LVSWSARPEEGPDESPIAPPTTSPTRSAEDDAHSSAGDAARNRAADLLVTVTWPARRAILLSRFGSLDGVVRGDLVAGAAVFDGTATT
jgi:hypothetical protein